MNRQDFINQLGATVLSDRRKTYGPPEKNFEIIAELWNAYWHNKGAENFAAQDIAVMMVLMKVARLIETPEHLDSWIDIAGYAACGAELVE